MKLMLTPNEVKCILDKVQEASDLFPALSFDKAMDKMNITAGDFINCITIGEPLHIDVPEADIINAIDTFGDLLLDSIAPALIIVRNGKRLEKRLDELAKHEQPIKVTIGKFLIQKAKVAHQTYREWRDKE